MTGSALAIARIEDLSRGRLLPVSTDGMEPTLHERGYAVVAPCDRVSSDGVYVLLHQGATIYRRCQLRVDGQIRLTLDNVAYRGAADCDMPTDEANAMVLGRVVGVCNAI
ncbi:S24 family peptidase [Thalassobaculum sp.]|uniref:S24 family peptidase n=1 Tax=Thalassobaculum sp. TaxID=2022740 RepID=UPI0032ED444D